MRWSDEYATGIPGVDEQHKMLFSSVGDFREALAEGVGSRTYGMLLEFLDQYTRGHFSFEEGCMEQYRCPVAQQNRDEHTALLRTLGQFRERFAARGYHADDARSLLDTLDHWLASHICRVDIHLKHCVGNAAR
ncbi:MAG: bacteriohemerythrin [Gemmatimonadaceae bacterium]